MKAHQYRCTRLKTTLPRRSTQRAITLTDWYQRWRKKDQNDSFRVKSGSDEAEWNSDEPYWFSIQPMKSTQYQAEFAPIDTTSITLPRLEYSALGAVHAQLYALAHNDHPFIDSGVLSCYRFASFDGFQRSHFFGRGRSLDLGQFERFRKELRSGDFAPLIKHQTYTVLSQLSLADAMVAIRVMVHSFAGEQACFKFVLQQAFGGAKDGIWLTRSLERERSADGDEQL